MNKVIQILIVLIKIFYKNGIHGQFHGNSTGFVSDTSEETNQFTLNFYNDLRTSERNDILISGLSLRTVMALLSAGAEGKTEQEIQEAFLFSENKQKLLQGYLNFLKKAELIKSDRKNSSLQSPIHPIKLEQSNRLFIKKGFPLSSSFQITAKYYFQAPVAQIDFSDGKKAAKQINAWVSRKTNNRIKEILSADSIDHHTRMVIVNTLYFKGPWETKFNGRETRTELFYSSPRHSTPVQMMQIEKYFPIANSKELDAKVLAIPYENQRFHMILILPNKRFGLEEVERKLRSIQFWKLREKLTKMSRKNILLNLPRFTIESEWDLIPNMKRMGVKTLFDEKMANLSGILNLDAYKNEDRKEPLVVSKLVQKAFLDVGEEGSEAGSATFAIVINPLSTGPSIDFELTFDHPFIGFIYDSHTQSILFMFRKTKFSRKNRNN